MANLTVDITSSLPAFVLDPSTVLRKLYRMYGASEPGPRLHDSGWIYRRETARRTAVAIERHRRGWTREGAMLEHQRRVMESGR